MLPTKNTQRLVFLLFLTFISLACNLNAWSQRNTGVDIGPPVNLPTDFPTSTVSVPPTSTSTKIAPTPTEENSSELPLSECLVPEDAYLWAYENVRQDGGSRAERCQANFVTKNIGDKPMWFSMYETHDNNAMKSERWSSVILKPGEQRTEDVNRTVYNNGVVTYGLTTRLFVTWDMPACQWIMLEENQPLWEGRAETVPPPCEE